MKHSSHLWPHRFVMKHRYGVSIFASVVLFVFASCGLVVANGETLRPDDSHIVNVYVDGQEQVVPTRALTVGDLVTKLNVSIGSADVIEPSPSTIIDGDNFKVRILRARPTTIEDRGKLVTLLSPEADPRTAVERAGIALDDEDVVSVVYPGDALTSRILGRKILIARATRVTVNVYGTAVVQRTQLKTVGELLASMNVVPAADDTVTPSLETPLTDDTAIFITKYGQQLRNVEEPIAFPVETEEDPNAGNGSVRVVQAGAAGKKIVTYQIELANGVEVGRKVIQETIVNQPVTQKVIKGTKPLFADYNADGIPARVFCGSPKQGNWKNINVGNAAAGRSLAAERGWTGAEFDALLELFACESSWNEKAGNPYSGAYGIPQSLPASKMASFGDDYMTNPITQLRWGLNYVAARYGTPSAALAFHYRNNYY